MTGRHDVLATLVEPEFESVPPPTTNRAHDPAPPICASAPRRSAQGMGSVPQDGAPRETAVLRTITTREELQEVIDRRRGYLYNDYGGREPRLCPIHDLATCPWLASMLRVAPGPLSLRKLWSEDLPELIVAIQTRGKVFGPCRSEPHLVRSLAELAPASPSQHERRDARPASLVPVLQISQGFVLQADPVAAVVRAWCPSRLTFEPRGDMLRLRNALANAVTLLDSDGARILHAVYVSERDELADTENVLFYNVGMHRFRRATLRGLRFERRFEPPEPSPDRRTFPHQHHYAMIDAAVPPARWSAGRTLARWERVPLDSSRAPLRVTALWRALHESPVELPGPDYAGWFGVRLHVQTGPGPVADAAALVKPLVDAVVAALHRHDGTDLDELSRRVAMTSGLEAGAAAGLLMRQDRARLGPRRLLWRWKDGVQWNPGDDACVLGELWIEPPVPAEPAWFRAEVFEVG